MSGNSESASKPRTNSPYFPTSESYQPIAASSASFSLPIPQGEQLHQQSPVTTYHSQHLTEGSHSTQFPHQQQIIAPSDHTRTHILEQISLIPTAATQEHSLHQFLMPPPQMQAQHNPQHIYYQKEDMSGHLPYHSDVVYLDISTNIPHSEVQNPNILYQHQLPPTQAPSSIQDSSAPITNQYDSNYISTISSSDYSSQYGHISTLPHFLQLQMQPHLPHPFVSWAGQSRNHEHHEQGTLHAPVQVGMSMSSYMGAGHRASYPGQLPTENLKAWTYKVSQNVVDFSSSERFKTNTGLSWPLNENNYRELIESIKRVTNMSINPFLLGLLHNFQFNIPIDDFYNCIYNNDDNSFKFLLNDDRKVDLSVVTNPKAADSSIKTLYKVLSLVKKIKTNPGSSLEGDEIRPLNFHELLRNFLAIKILSDMLTEVPDTSKPRAPPVTDSTIPRLSIYKTYFIICQLLIARYPSSSNTYQEQQKIVLSQSKVGKLIKLVYPELRIKRLGARGDSKYTYLGVRWNDSLVSASIKEMCNNNDLKDLLLIHSESDVVDVLVTPLQNVEGIGPLPGIAVVSRSDPKNQSSGLSEGTNVKRRKTKGKSIKTPTSQFLDVHFRRQQGSLEEVTGDTSAGSGDEEQRRRQDSSVYSSNISFIDPQFKYPEQLESPDVSLIGSLNSEVADSWFSDAKRNIYINYPFLSSSISEIIRNIAHQASHLSIEEDYLLNFVTSQLLRLYMQRQFGQQQEIRRAHYLKFEMHVFFALVLEFLPYFLLLKTRPKKDELAGDLIPFAQGGVFFEYLKINVHFLSENFESRYPEVFSLRDDNVNGLDDLLEDNVANWRKFLNLLRSLLESSELLRAFMRFTSADKLEMAVDFRLLEKYDTNYRNISFLGVAIDNTNPLVTYKEADNRIKMFEENIVLHNLLTVLLSYNVQSLLVNVNSIATFFTQDMANYLTGEFFKGKLDKDITLSDNSTSNDSSKSSAEDIPVSQNVAADRGFGTDEPILTDTQMINVTDLLHLVHSKLLTLELKKKYSVLICNSFFNSLCDDMVQYWRFMHVKNSRLMRQHDKLSSLQIEESNNESSMDYGGPSSVKLESDPRGTDIQRGQFVISGRISPIAPGIVSESLDKVQRCWLFLTFLRSYTLLMGEIVGLQAVLQQE